MGPSRFFALCYSVPIGKKPLQNRLYLTQLGSYGLANYRHGVKLARDSISDVRLHEKNSVVAEN